MYMLLSLALLLTLLLEPAAMVDPDMDQAISDGSSMDLDSPLPAYISNDPCSSCELHCLQCHCPSSPSYALIATMPFNNIPFTHGPILEADEAATHLAPISDSVCGPQHQLLMNDNFHCINMNETKVQAMTVLEHVKDTYTPGDRLNPPHPMFGKSPQRRQALRRGGFPCDVDACDKIFDRACDFNRHQKTHLGRSERPHKCGSCCETFLYPKDLERHQQKHIDEPAAKNHFQCHHPGCRHTFSRRDNLLRHQRRQHPALVAAAA